MNESVETDDCLEYQEQVMRKDEEVKVIIQKYANVDKSQELQAINKPERDAILREIKKIQGITHAN